MRLELDTAVILSAGLGTRMRPLTLKTPKPLLPLVGRPILAHVLERLSDAGVRQIIVNAHYLADQIEEWFLGFGVDGFLIQPSHLPGGLDDFVAMVIPELQERGLFRTEYEGTTLREHLGLPRPANQFFPEARQAAE